jgi:TetR/AcrR family transcriptional regulator, acrAB operon repressor
MRRTKEEAAETRELLLKTALKVFSQIGYTSTTLEDIAREAGVTRGAIYWHFGSKAELYHALIETYAARGSDIVQHAAAEGGTFPDILRRIFIRLLETIEGDPEMRAINEISLFKTERTPDLEAANKQTLDRGRALMAMVTEAMRLGIESGQLRIGLDPAETARAFLGMQSGAVYLWLQDPESFSLKGSAPALAEIFLGGILP